MSTDISAHIALNRFGYGIRSGDRPPDDARRYLLRQMERFDPKPAAIAAREDVSAKPGEILEMLRRLRRERQRSGGDTAMMDMSMGDEAIPSEVRQSYMSAGRFLRTDIALRTNVAIGSDTPFAERMVHFWANHFSVSAQKPGTHYQVGAHEFDAIRPHVFGRFSDMLRAAVLHPAMLLYLDQFQSVGPSSRFMQFRRRRQQGIGGGPQGLNENLAREIFELHTLGVDGGYSQGDVTEFAKALTGWTVSGIGRIDRFAEDKPNGAAFVAPAHEPGARQIMGRTYRDSGSDQALDVIADLARHPSTARFIAAKLARHFAGDEPPASLVAKLEKDFLATGGDLASLTRTLVEAPESWVAGPVKYRQPFEWLVASLRLCGVDDLDFRRISGALDQLGQLPWRAPSPAGYDDLEGSWAGPDALFRRVELAERLARNVRTDTVLEHAERAFPGALSDHTRTWLARAESGHQALGLLLVSPEMMRR
ncbi:hypothetical protein NAP1_02355 [Erythrobacter sp. NAP1]|uniref:DUF1800 domain-containing protein n=1 Tax=Erythrobacter sp. NAP1 TaxID=237727 RepID=UPI0000686B41|nr:DUF1800 domain-containing protein [Erythrobacter sp. NAP1]EAQ29577.1 hypothetical protein NAP1_02355 [Erythrobacter sp. NAP1]